MKHLDDLPKRDNNHDIQETAETAFRSAISACGEFIIQTEDRFDYGTDFQLEAKENGMMSNFRLHVQLKGTGGEKNTNGSISISVARTNLNYLLRQSSSIYVCYHLPSQKILFSYVEDIFREYEQQVADWGSQKTITVHFTKVFDENIQLNLKNKILADGISNRNLRLQFIKSPLDNISSLIKNTSSPVYVPSSVDQAKGLLLALSEDGKDMIISKSFENFSAVLQPESESMIYAYFAEINLGMNDYEIDEKRILKGGELFDKWVKTGRYDPGSLIYSKGNSWFALKKYEKAIETYIEALQQLSCNKAKAQCFKNYGTVMQYLEKEDEALELFKKSLELNPQLGEAHFAIALVYRKENNYQKMLEHLDQVVFFEREEKYYSAIIGWRIEALFNIGDTQGAYREINSLISREIKEDWVWHWCAKMVVTFRGDTYQFVQKAIQFWDLYLQQDPENIFAKNELIGCYYYKKNNEMETEIDFITFKQDVEYIINSGKGDVAMLWDRVGHWSQFDEGWEEAEKYFRIAYDMEPENYGYCLGVALNSLEKYYEALPILLDQAEKFLPGSNSWFQVALAKVGTDDIDGSISAYEKAIELDEEYDLAWFNLGGSYWNNGNAQKAAKIWKEALERFPSRELADIVRNDFYFLLIE